MTAIRRVPPTSSSPTLVLGIMMEPFGRDYSRGTKIETPRIGKKSIPN